MSELNVETKLRMMAKGHAVSGDVCRADYCAKLAIQLDGEKSKMANEIAELREGLKLMIEQFKSEHNCEYEYKIIKWNEELLNK